MPATTTKAVSKMHRTHIDLSEETRVKVCEILNQALATTLDLYSQVKQAHWNVKGLQFYSLHLLFDEIAGEVDAYVDDIAERITALAGTPLGTARSAAANSILPEYDLKAVTGEDHLKALIERLADYGKLVREGIDDCDDLNDMDSADLFTEISRVIDKRLWFLEAHIQA